MSYNYQTPFFETRNSHSEPEKRFMMFRTHVKREDLNSPPSSPAHAFQWEHCKKCDSQVTLFRSISWHFSVKGPFVSICALDQSVRIHRICSTGHQKKKIELSACLPGQRAVRIHHEEQWWMICVLRGQITWAGPHGSFSDSIFSADLNQTNSGKSVWCITKVVIWLESYTLETSTSKKLFKKS